MSKAVSGKTSYLVAGEILEDGRAGTESSKYRAAQEKKVKIVSEQEFQEILAQAAEEYAAASDKMNESVSAAVASATYPPPPPAAVAPTYTESASDRTSNGAILIHNNSKAPPPPPPTHTQMSTSSISSSSSSYGSSSSSSSSNSTRTDHTASAADMLWVDKYKPKTMQEIVGSQDVVKKLHDWLLKWDAMHVKKTLKVPYGVKENPGAKAALLSGPPGIGKTTMAVIVGQSCGFEVMELNASDARNKSSVEAMLSGAALSTSINGADVGKKNSKKRLVVLFCLLLLMLMLLLCNSCVYCA